MSPSSNMEKVNLVPGFILKLWKMINDPHCDDLISWSENGQSFIITDPPRFSKELSKYFKHNNLSSFIRQLNMYGFRKVATIENSGLHPGGDDLHFYHPDFIKGRSDRLEAIKRKLPQKLAESVDLRNVYKGITEIEDKQKDVSQKLADIKRENEMLWAELHDLRQKHQQQQLYISRLMKLVFEAMEQNGIKTNMLQLKRNSPLMIEGASVSGADGLIDASEIALATTTAAAGIGAFTTTTSTAGHSSAGVISPPISSPTVLSPNANNTDEDTHLAKKSRLTSDDENQATIVYPTATSYQIPTSIEQLPTLEQQIDSIDYGQLQSNLLSNSNNGDDEDGSHANHQQNADNHNKLDTQSSLGTPIVIPTDCNDGGHLTSPYQVQLQSLPQTSSQLPNVEAQIVNAEYQIDSLVPTIGDFSEEELNFFAD